MDGWVSFWEEIEVEYSVWLSSAQSLTTIEETGRTHDRIAKQMNDISKKIVMALAQLHVCVRVLYLPF